VVVVEGEPRAVQKRQFVVAILGPAILLLSLLLPPFDGVAIVDLAVLPLAAVGVAICVAHLRPGARSEVAWAVLLVANILSGVAGFVALMD
jgi:hypothetical protein